MEIDPERVKNCCRSSRRAYEISNKKYKWIKIGLKSNFEQQRFKYSENR